ncbi:signal sequence receptor alpha subunit [Histoplasma capsulatum H143]|uniref:Signal recognition particle receptor subunit alpha homolog n=1 Tax=Ajellomyces capsulatus (strain H143) TaxID=544712 RepID=C6H695_AJECH|nr:signal sequence receptor alpha subunit [Histoplasma capsulatum H143]
MLDSFEIITSSGVVLWSRSYAPVGAHVINSLINDVFIEEKFQQEAGSGTVAPRYRKEKYTLKWKRAKDLGLIFVAVYQSLLHLTWIDELLENIKTIFVEIYNEQLKKPNSRIIEYRFDKYFDQQVKELESAAGKTVEGSPSLLIEEKKDTLVEADNGGPPPPPIPGLLPAQRHAARAVANSNESSPSQTPETSRPATPNHIITAKAGPGGRTSRRARKAANSSANVSSGEDTIKKAKNAKSAVKKMRKWDSEGFADEDNGEILDYSAPNVNGSESEEVAGPPVEAVDQNSWGTKTKKGQFVLKDLGDEVHSILQDADAAKDRASMSNGVVGSSLGAISGLFRNIVGGKVLTKADLDKPLKAMEEHLLKKNVAREAAVRLCDGVEQELIGKKTGSFQSIDAALRAAMESSLRKILTPTSSLDLLREIEAVTSPSNSQNRRRPYVISIVGVNGVGKSTNLSKICFFLLQNNYRVLIAACDTFRSGAVEQLRVHARNLKELSARENVGQVELYEKGYGKDAANVAKDAVAYAAMNNFDVVLIDTAGRRHNDQRLMSSLEKFAKFAQPDKIFMVGEALVGTDSVMQARNFNQAFGTGRKLDGFIMSKCDTVGDMVGALVTFSQGVSWDPLLVNINVLKITAASNTAMEDIDIPSWGSRSHQMGSTPVDGRYVLCCPDWVYSNVSNVQEAHGRSKSSIKKLDGYRVAYFDAKFQFLQVRPCGPPYGPPLGATGLREGVMYLLSVRWPESEKKKWQSYQAETVAARGSRCPQYTPEEKAWLKKHYGGEFHFLRSFCLKIYNDEDREEGWYIVRAMMEARSEEDEGEGAI